MKLVTKPMVRHTAEALTGMPLDLMHHEEAQHALDTARDALEAAAPMIAARALLDTARWLPKRHVLVRQLVRLRAYEFDPFVH